MVSKEIMSEQRQTSELMVECPHCGHTLNPNDESTRWEPSFNIQVSVGAIRCPECSNSADFLDWRTWTGSKTT